MIKHFCDICHKQILELDRGPDIYSGEVEGKRYKIIIVASLLPTGKIIEVCKECILKAIRG